METRTSCDREHDFALVLSGVADLTPEVMDALFVSGCDDATPSMRSGRLYLTFSRTAPSLKDAILSSIRNVRSADIGAEWVRVDSCNLVTLAEIGRRIDRSRQLVHQYTTGVRGPGGFPPPTCHISETPLYAWCEVAHWLSHHNMIKQEVLSEALQIEMINSILDWQYQKHIDPAMAEELIGALGLV